MAVVTRVPSQGVRALVLLGLAVLLRIALAYQRPLGVDDVFSLAMATGHSLEHPAAEANPRLGDYVEWPGAELPALYRRYIEHERPPASAQRVVRAVLLSDTSPPLYYLLLHGWTRALGTSDTALRCFSVFWALAALPLLWLLGRHLGGNQTALSACVLYAFAPVSLYYSVEGRMYSLLWFLTLALAWGTVELQRRGPRPWWALLWCVAGSAGLLTHYFFAFVWIACITWLIMYPGRLRRSSLLALLGVAALLTLPWYRLLPESFSRWRVSGQWLYGDPISWRYRIKAPIKLAWSLLASFGDWDGSKSADRLTAALFLLLGLGWARRGMKSLFSPPYGLLWLWLAAACLGPLAFDLVRGTDTASVARYALPGMPAAMLLAAVGLGQIGPRARLVFLALILATWAPGIRAVFTFPSRSWEPLSQVGTRLAAWGDASDLIIVHSIPSGVLGIARYMHGSAPILSWVGQLHQRRVPSDLVRALEARRKVALVKIVDIGEPAPEEIWLRQHANLTGEDSLRGAQVFYFAPGRGDAFPSASASGPRPDPPGLVPRLGIATVRPMPLKPERIELREGPEFPRRAGRYPARRRT